MSIFFGSLLVSSFLSLSIFGASAATATGVAGFGGSVDFMPDGAFNPVFGTEAVEAVPFVLGAALSFGVSTLAVGAVTLSLVGSTLAVFGLSMGSNFGFTTAAVVYFLNPNADVLGVVVKDSVFSDDLLLEGELAFLVVVGFGVCNLLPLLVPAMLVVGLSIRGLELELGFVALEGVFFNVSSNPCKFFISS